MRRLALVDIQKLEDVALARGEAVDELEKQVAAERGITSHGQHIELTRGRAGDLNPQFAAKLFVIGIDCERAG